MANKTNELSHSKWVCKYHIVFTPKYRRKIIYNQYREDLIEIFKRLCSYKGVEIIEGHMIHIQARSKRFPPHDCGCCSCGAPIPFGRRL